LAVIAREAMLLAKHHALDLSRFITITTERAGNRLSFDELALKSAADVAVRTYG